VNDALQQELASLRAERDTLRAQLGRAESRLGLFREMANRLRSSMRHEEIARNLAKSVQQVMEAEASAIYLVEREGDHLVTWIHTDTATREIRLAMGEGIAGWVALNGNSVNIKDAYRDDRFQRQFDEASGFRTRSVLCQPLRELGGRVIGVVQVINKTSGDYFTVEDELTLGTVNALVSAVIYSNNSYIELLDNKMALEETESELRASLAHLNLVFELQQQITGARDAEAIVGVIAERMARTFDCRGVSIFLLDGAASQEYTWTEDPAHIDRLVRTSRTWDSTVRDGVIASGKPRLIHPPSTSNELIGSAGRKRAATDVIESMLVVPLTDGDRIFGALELVNRRTPRVVEKGRRVGFSGEDLQVSRVVASDIGALIARSLAERQTRVDEQMAAMGRMMSGVVHDLKSPLGVASGYVQMIVKSDDRARREQFAVAIRSQFELITRMTRELLAYARGETNVFYRTVHMHAFADELREQLGHEMDSAGIEVTVTTHYRGDAQFDDGKLKRVLFNLARNAREAMVEGGRYDVEFTREGCELVIRCSDTGPGIDPAIQDRIFDAFVTSGKPGNSGLGLAIVKKMVDDHHGRVSFISQPGAGTTFEIRLPLEPPEQRHEQAQLTA